QLRAAPGRVGRGLRRAPPPAGPVLRRGGRRGDRRAGRRPHPRHGHRAAADADPGRHRPPRAAAARRPRRLDGRGRRRGGLRAPARGARGDKRPAGLRRHRPGGLIVVAPLASPPAARPAPRAAEVVRRLELTLGRRVDGLLHGRHLGRIPGLGSEPAESRRYVPGDDPRRMDWNVTARTRVPHVRDAVAERELVSWLVVDLSPSTGFGTARCTKRDLVVAAASALVVLASRAGDRVGAHLLTHEGVATFPPVAGGAHARALLEAIAAAPLPDRDPASARPGPDLGDALDRAARTAGRRGLVAVLSDFPGTGGWVPPLRSLAA